MHEETNNPKEINATVLVAHPDDETIWAGGLILENPDWNWTIICLCRANDGDRAPKFYRALEMFGAKGIMADLDDGPEQNPLDLNILEDTIVDLLSCRPVNLIFSHSPYGEYTRHLRHEEIGKSVIKLWEEKRIKTDELWLFAYRDNNMRHVPKPIPDAHFHLPLGGNVFKAKRALISSVYGFSNESWEFKACNWTEAFWCFLNAEDASKWFKKHSRK
ncbi:PIG-L deacetylase family protein [Echinicola salinicaeni]|uniref:PIG-L deacetylase family protein n=1 Tax=Echinicola salinicaeni TaxID=2762757 RepID=UPI001644A701|nr:PIG-L family deacetylase [Echinicola salinicaeni]